MDKARFFTCPECGQAVYVDPAWVGDSGLCPSCGADIPVGELVRQQQEQPEDDGCVMVEETVTKDAAPQVLSLPAAPSEAVGKRRAEEEAQDAKGPEEACRSFKRAFIVEIVFLHLPLFIKVCESPEGLLVAVPSLLVHLVAYGFVSALFEALCAIWKELRRANRRGNDGQ